MGRFRFRPYYNTQDHTTQVVQPGTLKTILRAWMRDCPNPYRGQVSWEQENVRLSPQLNFL
jgi:hypothetical protein